MSEVIVQEEWRAVPGFDGWYDVSSLGRVRSWKKRNGRNDAAERLTTPRMLATGKSSKGYSSVTLHRNGRDIPFSVHRLVLTAFVGPRPRGNQCRHMDRCKANNALTNLRWGTGVENCDDKRRHGTSPDCQRNPAAKLTNQAVLEIRALLRSGVRVKTIAGRYGVTPEAIYLMRQGKTWKTLTEPRNHVEIIPVTPGNSAGNGGFVPASLAVDSQSASISKHLHHAPLAQLDRAAVFGTATECESAT